MRMRASSLPAGRNTLPGAVLVACVAAAACRERASPELVTSAAALQQPGTATRLPLTSSRRTAIVDAAERVGRSVVSVAVTSRRQVAPGGWEFFLPPVSDELVRGYGTGFVVRPNGIILTNQHVVAGAEDIEVTLSDGTDLPAKLLGEDALTDIAVLKVDRVGLPAVPLGRSTDLMIGEWVVALGNPFAYMLGNSEPTVTAGVVSATGRNILPSREQAGLYLDMIQTDASINPGNSGGPLTNALGEVVGVNSSIFSQSGGSIGLGFAIPIERALRVADEIIRRGAVTRAWLGLNVAGAESMRDWKTSGGVLITSIAPGGPAERAGLRKDDVLTEANGRRLRNYLDWEAVKLDLHVGDSVRLTIRQGDRTATRILVTGDLPTMAAEKVNVLQDLELVTLTPQIQAERSVQSEQGALVYRITPKLSQQTGLQSGDVIVALNRRYVRSAEDVSDALKGLGPQQLLRVVFERDGRISFTDLMFR